MASNELTQDEAFLVPSGWEWCDIIRRPGRDGFRLLHYPGGTTRFEHRCDRGERGVIICAPSLSPTHALTHAGVGAHGNPHGAPTVTPSILCPDCGTHGFVTDGWWRE